MYIAAVATARKLAVLVWHLLAKEEDFLWARPSLNETKRRTQELKTEMPAAKGRRGRAHAPISWVFGIVNGHG